MTFLAAPACRIAGRFASSGSQGRKLSILLYHRVLGEPDPLRPDEFDQETFRLHMEVLADCFNVLPLDRAAAMLGAGALPPRAVCITFDDGYADNESIALPILLELGLTATFFVATGFLNGGRMWNDSVIEAIRVADKGTLDLREAGCGVHELGNDAQRLAAVTALLPDLKYQSPVERDAKVARIISTVARSVPDDLMMTSDQVCNLVAAGMTIGAHTVRHPILARLDDQDARTEILQSRNALEEITGSAISLFAFPNGKPGIDYGRRDVDLLKDLGVKTAVSTAWGVCTRKSDRWQLPRFTPWDKTRGRFALRMLHNYSRTSPDLV